MESNWRYNRELFGMGGTNLGLPGDNRPLKFLAELITPVNLGGGLIATHIAAKLSTVFGTQYTLGRLIPVGSSGFYQWLSADSRPPGERFPFPLFPVHPDS